MVATLRHQRAASAGSNPGTYTGSRSGAPYKLGQEIGSGGNGIVYALSRRPQLVAKLQRVAPSEDDIEKLDLLVRSATPELLAVSAWPADCLKDRHGRIVGYVMPRILDARPLYELYSPRSRVQHFPAADFRFLVHAAANVARLFGAVHQAGFICGDINHSNILVRQSGTVVAVDCDSFQVGDGTRFPCLVGTDLFIPPELMGVCLATARRTTDHDNFGLAVLIFHLLFMGRHPFAGRFLGRGEMPIEQAIAECRYAYSRETRRTQIVPPPLTLPIEAAGLPVVDLLERAFDPQAKVGGRPTPEAWIDALDTLKASLIACKRVSYHNYYPSAGGCPWCIIEKEGRIKLFGGVVKTAVAQVTDLETLWARYLALVEPGQPRPLPVVPPKAHDRWLARLGSFGLCTLSPRSQGQCLKTTLRSCLAQILCIVSRVRGDRLLFAFCASHVGLVVYGSELRGIAEAAPEIVAKFASDSGVVFADGPSFALTIFGLLLGGSIMTGFAELSMAVVIRLFIKPRLKSNGPISSGERCRVSERAWMDAADARKNQPAPPDVSQLKPRIEALKQRLDALAAEREARIRACAAVEPEEKQRSRYLASFRIEDAQLANLGSARCAVLRSWGIDTAADVDEAKIAEIPGFGKSLTDKLVVWRELKEKAFEPNRVAIVDPLEVQRIERQLAARRTELMKDLRERISELEQRLAHSHEQRGALWAKVEDAFKKRMIAAR